MKNDTEIDETDLIRGYFVSHKAWYKDQIKKPSISFGMYVKGDTGGTSGEMSMVWENLGGELSAQLQCYDDAFIQLYTFKDLLLKLSKLDNKTLKVEYFIQILNECGFKDLTDYIKPE